MKNKKKVLLIIAPVLLLIIAVAGSTYAFFTANITNGDKGSSVIIQTGNLRVVYSDTEYINVSGILPGDSYSKTVIVTNAGNVGVNYDLVWIELLNELTTKTDFVMSMTCTSSTDTCDGYSETTVANSGSYVPIMYGIPIAPLEVHTYVITLKFKETGSVQNDNQGKIISGKIGIIETGNLDLYGYIYDENGDPMSSTVVEIHSDPMSTITDANGYYELNGIPFGNHTVYVKAIDTSSTIMTKQMSLEYGETTVITDSNVVVNQDKKTIGLNIQKTLTTPSIILSSNLKGIGGVSSYTGEYYAVKSLITSINFDNAINVPGDAVSSWDVSVDNNGAVMSYIKSDGISGYELHIQSNGKTYAPANSSYLFNSFTKVTAINGLQNFDTSKVTNMGNMFRSMTSLTSLDLSHFDTGNVTNMNTMFYLDSSLTSLNVSSFDTSKVTNMAFMFASLTKLPSLDLSHFNTSSATTMAVMFSSDVALTSLDLSSFNTSNVTEMSSMFNNMTGLTSLDLSHFNTSKVLNMSSMFYNMTGITTLNLNNFDTSSVTNMYQMFALSSNITSLNISSFNTSNVTNMQQMFSGMKINTLNLNHFNTSKVTNMASMFQNMSNLTSLSINNFDTSNVTSMSGMFSGLSSLTTVNLSSFNTSKVLNMSSMFQNMSSITSLNLNSFNTGAVTNMSNIFNGMSSMTTLNLSNASFTKVTLSTGMFANITSGIVITAKDSTAQSFINIRLTAASKTGTVNIG